MIVSCEIMFFVNVCSNMIEMKMFVLTGTILQNKISRGVIQYTLDLLSISNYVIKKGRPHGHTDMGKLHKRKNIIKPIF